MKGRILILSDEGVGDIIMFSSVLDKFLKIYPNITTNIDSRHIGIFNYNFPGVSIIPYTISEDEIQKYDTILYYSRLLKYFIHDINCFRKTPYINIPNIILENNRKKLSFLKNKIKIGLSWKSNHEKNAYYNINLYTLLPILKLKNVDFINLQYSNIDKEINKFTNDTGIVIHTIKDIDLKDDFVETNALLKNLDLLVSISNTTAHFSGSLGVPTYLMSCPVKPFYYWKMNLNNKNLWYNSVRIFDYNPRNSDNIILEMKECIIDKFNL